MSLHDHSDVSRELHLDRETLRFLHSLHCGHWSLLHNRNFAHSNDELNLRHLQLEHLGLLELVADDHRDVTHTEISTVFSTICTRCSWIRSSASSLRQGAPCGIYERTTVSASCQRHVNVYNGDLPSSAGGTNPHHQHSHLPTEISIKTCNFYPTTQSQS